MDVVLGALVVFLELAVIGGVPGAIIGAIHSGRRGAIIGALAGAIVVPLLWFAGFVMLYGV